MMLSMTMGRHGRRPMIRVRPVSVRKVSHIYFIYYSLCSRWCWVWQWGDMDVSQWSLWDLCLWGGNNNMPEIGQVPGRMWPWGHSPGTVLFPLYRWVYRTQPAFNVNYLNGISMTSQWWPAFSCTGLSSWFPHFLAKQTRSSWTPDLALRL